MKAFYLAVSIAGMVFALSACRIARFTMNIEEGTIGSNGSNTVIPVMVP